MTAIAPSPRGQAPAGGVIVFRTLPTRAPWG